MKGLAGVVLGGLFLVGCTTHAQEITASAISREYTSCVSDYAEECSAENALNIKAKSAFSMDYETNTPIISLNEEVRLPIASMCKIMTLILCFDAIDEGNLSMDESITVSERAASMGGSQVFLEANAKYSVKELIKSIVVCSANDSCVALAERIAGNDSVFTDKMNEKAKELGANNTLFANCTGLPKEPQYSCAKDVAVMLKELLTHEEYYDFGKVWLDKFAHPEGRYTEITNTNKLIRFYDGCDGGKTGFTNQAGFCLAATAKRGDMRIISVVIGEETSAKRFDDVRTMFDYAFANYVMTPIVKKEIILEEKAVVFGGKHKNVEVSPSRSSYVFSKKGEKPDIKTETVWKNNRAPIKKGQCLGEIIVYENSVERERIPLISKENVNKASFFDRMKDVSQHWNARKA